MRKKVSKITPEHMALYSMIPIGHKNAVTKDTLQILTGMSERVIRQYCEDLTCNKYVVCNLQDGKGYYRPETEQDYIAVLNLTLSRANSLKRKSYGIKTALQAFYAKGNVLCIEDEKPFNEKN